MADAENFEDELFADLYNDDDAAKPVAQSAPAFVEPPAQAVVTTAHDEAPLHAEDTYIQEAQANDEQEEDDDDDVDFNLGGSGQTNGDAAQHDISEISTVTSPPPSRQPPSNKEDG